MTGPFNDSVQRPTIAIISWRILPLIGLGYLFALMDRVNVSFAALQMSQELRFSATIYGMGAGAFYLAYALFEVPSNMLLTRFGARRWLARIMVTWSLIAAAIMFVGSPVQFYILRFMLGAALPAAGVGIAMFFLLADSPSSVRWLRIDQSIWIERELNTDAARMPPTGSTSLAAALSHPATARFALLGMLATGWISDRRSERFTTMWITTTVMGLAFAMTAIMSSPSAVAVAYLLYANSWGGVTLSQVSALPDCLHGRVLALGCAVINTLSQLGAFLMPILWGRLADATGDFRAGPSY